MTNSMYRARMLMVSAICFSGIAACVAARRGAESNSLKEDGQVRISLQSDVLFDISDVSYLWPLPSQGTPDLRLDPTDKLADDSEVLPQHIFDQVLSFASGGSLTNTATGQSEHIDSTGVLNGTALMDRKNWRVVGFRADPCFPSLGLADVSNGIGCVPDLRLILQPIHVNPAPLVTGMQDVAAHLLFSFVKSTTPQRSLHEENASPAPEFKPDLTEVSALLQDLQELKIRLTKAGVTTDGKSLGVHPGLLANPRITNDGRGLFANNSQIGDVSFQELVKIFLKKHLKFSQLDTIAFMTSHNSEAQATPNDWAFFTGKVRSERSDETAQFVVMPMPNAANRLSQLAISAGRGFDPLPTNADRSASGAIPRPGLGVMRDTATGDAATKDFLNILANPDLSSTTNTDCGSCHSESNFTVVLDLARTIAPSPNRYLTPSGITGYTASVPQSLAGTEWVFRSFGFYLSGPTVSVRTANESAAVADFINSRFIRATNDVRAIGPGKDCRNTANAAGTQVNDETYICVFDAVVRQNALGQRIRPGYEAIDCLKDCKKPVVQREGDGEEDDFSLTRNVQLDLANTTKKSKSLVAENIHSGFGTPVKPLNQRTDLRGGLGDLMKK